ncbi:MAG: DUF421 domain-containing protein [Chloroflexi bacterium]|nr:DUF421 domain-containing protein [Chloroflexota bacterium]
MIFDTWYDIFRVIVVGTVGYIGLIAFLRISGKRTLSKMNMFDFVVTITLGSTFASTILSSSVSIAEGLTAILLLIGLQYIVAWLAARVNWFAKLVKGSPTLLFYNGHYLPDVLKKQRIVKEEVRFAMRAQGFTDLDQVGAVILETNGDMTVIPDVKGDLATLQDVDLPSEQT